MILAINIRSLITNSLLPILCLCFLSFPVQANSVLDTEVSIDNLKSVYKEEIKYVNNAQYFNVDELWALTKIGEITNDKSLDILVNKRAETIKADPFLPLLRRDAKRIALPESPGIGVQKLFTFMASPFGEPASRSRNYIEQFISHNGTGYILTHQLLTLIWAEESGLIESDSFQPRKHELLDSLYNEQMNDASFSDLYVERVVLLLLNNKGIKADRLQWISTILDSRQQDGGWGEFETRLAFEGQEATIKSGDMHTRVLALWSIQLYLGYQ